jgi:DNA primase
MSLLPPSSPSLKRSLANATAEYQQQLQQDGPAHAYLEARGLSPVTSSLRFGVVRSPLAGHERYRGRLAIPFLGPTDNVYDIRYRCIDGHGEEGHPDECPKYLGSDGVRTRIYNARALTASADYIFITEGELDAATLTVCGWPAIGIPGAQAWKAHYPRLVAGFSQVVVVGDGDKAGRDFARKVSESLPDARMIVMLDGLDVNSVFTSDVARDYSNNGRKGYLSSLLREEEA